MVLERNSLKKNVESSIFLMFFHELCDIWKCYDTTKDNKDCWS